MELIPPDARYGAAGAGGSAGASNAGLVLGGVAAGMASQFAEDLLASPAVQAKLESVQVECKERAKQGVGEFLRENWPWLLLGAAAVSTVNFLMLAFGVVPLVRGRES